MKHLFVGAFLLYVVSIFAQPPINYYQPAYKKSGTQLRTALQGIIDNHTVVSYNGLYDVYETSDNTADNKVWDMYSYCSGHTTIKRVEITPKYVIVTIANTVFRKVGLTKIANGIRCLSCLPNRWQGK